MKISRAKSTFLLLLGFILIPACGAATGRGDRTIGGGSAWGGGDNHRRGWRRIVHWSSLYSTLGDMYLYDQALRTNKLVRADTLANNGDETAYGFGVELGEYSGNSYIGHSGAWLGFESYYLHIPGQNLSVVVMLNRVTNGMRRSA